MKITFNEIAKENISISKSSYNESLSIKSKENTSYRIEKSESIIENLTYSEKESEFSSVPSGDESTIKNKRNQMAIMSNIMSDEDYKKMLDDGTSCMDMDVEEVVTIVDKIKVEMMKSGQHIQGYTDDLDLDKICEITGSQVLAENLSNAYTKNQVPITIDKIEDSMLAINRANELVPISADSGKYLVKNQLEPTIENVYKAQFSSVKEPQANTLEIPFSTELNAQLEDVITKAGFEVTEETISDAKWLLSQQIPLTDSTFTQYEQIKTIQIPIALEDLCNSIASAIINGEPALQANLFDQTNRFEAVWNMEQEVFDQLKSDLTLKRQAEEIRLMMTTEANLKLIKSGYFIDTEDLEQFVNILKEEENKVAEQMFEKTTALPELELFKQVDIERNRLYDMSNAIVGQLNVQIHSFTVHELYEVVDADSQKYEQANQQYEKCMTQPRSDLGDSIKQAFQNTDDILEALKLPTVEENQKAIRALSYNGMELTVENIEAVKEASRVVEKTVAKMTPPTVIQMIKDGMNPLEYTFEQLNDYFDTLQPSYQEESEKYSKYLYKLEQKQEITAEEKEAYIGIYRLLRQIEKSDQGAIGQVLEQGVNTEFGTLLSAIRTSKAKGMDIVVNEQFGGLEELIVQGVSITDQIKAGFKGDFTAKLAEFETEEAKLYSKEMCTQIQQLSGVEDEAIQICNRFSLATSPNNLFAIQDMIEQKSALFKRLNDNTSKVKKELAQKIDSLHDAFNSPEEALNAYNDVIEATQEVIEEATFSEAKSSEEIKMLKISHKQLSIASKMAEREEYEIPAYIGGELTSIHLVLQHDDVENGSVEIRLLNSEEKQIGAKIKVNQEAVSCDIYYEGAAEDSAKNLGQLFYEALEKNGILTEQPNYNYGFMNQSINNSQSEEIETRDLYRLAKIFIHTVNQL